jgi:hypothetical protein
MVDTQSVNQSADVLTGYDNGFQKISLAQFAALLIAAVACASKAAQVYLLAARPG